MNLKNCCSGLAQSLISCDDLEDTCAFWAQWLKGTPNCANFDTDANIGFTNKDFVYRNAFYALQKLQNDVPWFFYVDATKDEAKVELSACNVHALPNHKNETIKEFLALRNASSTYFLLIMKRKNVLLVFIKSYKIDKFLSGDAVLMKHYELFKETHELSYSNKNFLADDIVTLSSVKLPCDK